jgi:hypothetical protein
MNIVRSVTSKNTVIFTAVRVSCITMSFFYA